MTKHYIHNHPNLKMNQLKNYFFFFHPSSLSLVIQAKYGNIETTSYSNYVSNNLSRDNKFNLIGKGSQIKVMVTRALYQGA